MTRRDAWTAAPGPTMEGTRPGNAGGRGRTAADPRPFVKGVMWVLRSGAPGTHRPARYGPGKRPHTRCPRGAQAGRGERRCGLLRPAPNQQELRSDSTIGRAPQPSAAGKGGRSTRRWGVPAEDGRRTSPARRRPTAARCAGSSRAGRPTRSRQPRRWGGAGRRRR